MHHSPEEISRKLHQSNGSYLINLCGLLARFAAIAAFRSAKPPWSSVRLGSASFSSSWLTSSALPLEGGDHQHRRAIMVLFVLTSIESDGFHCCHGRFFTREAASS